MMRFGQRPFGPGSNLFHARFGILKVEKCFSTNSQRALTQLGLKEPKSAIRLIALQPFASISPETCSKPLHVVCCSLGVTLDMICCAA